MNTTDKPKSPSIAIIYHQYCADGIVAAAICGMTQQIINDKKAYGPDANWMEENIVFLPASYKKPMPKLPETVNKVYVVDFSFGIKEVNKVIEESQRVIWFSITDHHETSMKAYCDCKYLHRTHNSEEGYDFFMPIESSVVTKSPYLLPTYFTALIDQSKSAALLCYEEFAREYQARFKHPPTEDNIIEYVARRISDRDLWNFVYPETRAIYEMLISFIDYHKKNAPLDIVRFFDEKSKGGGLLESQMYIEANARVEMRLQLAKEYADKAKVINFDGMKVALVNVPSNFSSEVGDVLGKDHDFAIMYVVGGNDQVIFGLRSNKETGVNVEVIAKQHFNGGGHVNAAGGNGTLETLRKLYNMQVL